MILPSTTDRGSLLADSLAATVLLAAALMLMGSVSLSLGCRIRREATMERELHKVISLRSDILSPAGGRP